MIKVVLDTNVIISGMFWKGKSNKILRACLKRKLQPVTSVDLLRELEMVLVREKKFGLSQQEIQKIVQLIASISKVVSSSYKINFIKSDPADNKLLECARTGKVNYIISGDKHLTSLKNYKRIKILKPAEAVKLLLP